VVCGGQTTDLSVLQGKGRSQANVQESVGEAALVLRSAAGLDSVLGGLATAHHFIGARNQLDTRPGMIRCHSPILLPSRSRPICFVPCLVCE